MAAILTANFSMSNLSLQNVSAGHDVLSDEVYVSVVTASLIAIFAAVSACYNLLILAAFLSAPRIRTSFNWHLINLSCADLSIALLAMPSDIRSILGGTWSDGEALCGWLLYSGMVCTSAGAHGVMWIAVDRLLSITWPLWYRQHRSSKLSMTICSAMWVYVVVIPLPFAVKDRVQFAASDLVCALNFAAQTGYSLALQIVCYILPLTVVACSYGIVAYKLAMRRMKIRNMVAVCQTTETDKQAGRQEHKQFLTLAWLTVFMVLLWSPAIVFFSMVGLDDRFFNPAVSAIVLCVQYSNCAINPFVYHRALPEVDRAIRKLLRCRAHIPSTPS